MGEGARMILVLFGDLRDPLGRRAVDVEDRVRTAYLKQKAKVEDLGYTLGFAPGTNGTSKGAFLRLLQDNAAFAVVWLSHGAATGELQDRDGELIRPKDVSGVGDNLQFAALWGCSVRQAGPSWRRALRLDRFADAEKRLASSWTTLKLEDYERSLSANLAPPFITFVTEGNNRFATYYSFQDWLRLLPR